MKPPSKAQLEAAESDFDCAGWKAMVRERNSRIIHLEAELRDANRRLDNARASNRAWIKENGPGGWIDNLRIRLEVAEQDSRRLDWVNENPSRISASAGYLGKPDCWCWWDKAKLALHEAPSLRAAIDAAMQASEAKA